MKQYNLSKYIKKIRYSDEDVILYNTINSDFVLLSADYVRDFSRMSQDELATLSDMGFFKTEQEVFDDIVEQLDNMQPGLLNVIIEMTTACNFRCNYCYQNDWNKSNEISYEILDMCVRYIEKCLQRDRFSGVGVSFFGGEPLLAKEKIYYTYDKIKKVCLDYSLPLYTEVTSNGYLLDRNFLEHFERISFLTTLSLKEDHDKKRKHLAAGATYEHIFKNILDCRDLFATDKYMLGIRYNTDLDNIGQFSRFLDELRHNGITAKIQTSYTYEHSINNYYNLLSFRDYQKWCASEAIIELIRHGYKVFQVPKVDIVPCFGYDKYAVKVFANGSLGMCNASIDESTIRGNIVNICSEPDKVIEIFPEKKLKPILNFPCSKCLNKCLCGGIKFCRQQEMCCFSDIDIDTFLKTYLDLIQSGESELVMWDG